MKIDGNSAVSAEKSAGVGRSSEGGNGTVASVTKNMTIGETIQTDQNIIEILLNYGMHCIGCPSAQGETLEEACMVHGLDVEPLVEEINAYLSSK